MIMPYAIAAVVTALLTGLAMGWIIWGAAARKGPIDGAGVQTSDLEGGNLGDRLASLCNELQDARRQLVQAETDERLCVEDLAKLEASINRANGRLKSFFGGAGA